MSLNPGESIPLWFSVRINAREQQAANRCSIINRVRITDAPGGSPGNLNAGDDEAKAEAQTPGPNCVPETGKRSDLSITKEAKGCEYTPGAGGFACAYQVVVRNEGPDDFAGVVTVHDEPAGAAAAPLFAGPWACVPAGAGFDCSLDLSAAPLAAGESRPLNMAMMVSLNSQVCEVSNQASIKAPAGGTDANSNPGNDASGAVTQAVPSPECDPAEAEVFDLFIMKSAAECVTRSPNSASVAANPLGVICTYKVTVQNIYPGDVNVPVVFSDAPDVGGVAVVTHSAGQPGWTCSEPGPTVTCSNPTGMHSGAIAAFNVTVETTSAQVLGRQCRVLNRAWIAEPLGAPWNSIAADDVATAIANGPLNICTDVQDQKIEVCPTERQMPDQGCCPEGQRWTGKSCSGGSTPPKVCPSGTTGTYPNCKTPPKQVCPSGTTGKYPNCKTAPKPVCPSGTTGKYPNCNPIADPVCPPGTKGTYPNCTTIPVRYCPSDSVGTYPKCVCRKGTYGEPGNCRRKECPKGTVGKWPACEAIPPKCPKGTHGKYPKCLPNVCPKGSYGEWPNCYTPGGETGTPKKCPKGTYGTYPNCKRIGNNDGPNTNCPDGYEYSKKVKTCVRKKNQKRKQQEQPQQQQPLLQTPTLKVDPNLLQPQ